MYSYQWQPVVPKFPKSTTYIYPIVLTMGSFISSLNSSITTSTEKTPPSTMAVPAFSHFPNAQTEFKPPLIANNNAFLGDVVSRYIFPYPLFFALSLATDR